MYRNCCFSFPKVDLFNSYTQQESSLAHPRVHSVWNELIHCVANNPKSDFEEFWRISVDGMYSVMALKQDQ